MLKARGLVKPPAFTFCYPRAGFGHTDFGRYARRVYVDTAKRVLGLERISPLFLSLALSFSVSLSLSLLMGFLVCACRECLLTIQQEDVPSKKKQAHVCWILSAGSGSCDSRCQWTQILPVTWLNCIACCSLKLNTAGSPQ